MKQSAESLLFTIYGNSPKMRIIDYFLKYPLNEFSKAEVIEGVGMSKTTITKPLCDLLKLGMVIPTSKQGKAQLMQINKDNPIVKSILLTISVQSDKIADNELMKQSAKMLRELKGVIRGTTSIEKLKIRKKLLREELTATTKLEKTIPLIRR